MKRLLFISIILSSFILSSFGIGVVTKEEGVIYLKQLGMTDAQIVRLDKIENIYNKTLTNAMEQSREYRAKNPGLGNKAYDSYFAKLKNKAYKNYTKELGKVLNSKQKKKYLEYRSRIN